MQTLFDPGNRDALVRRLSDLRPTSPRQWGKMTAAQMLAHCAASMEVPCGDLVKAQSLLGRVLAPFVRPSVLGPKPFVHNAPTDPDLKIADERDFEKERARLGTLIDRFCQRGPEATDGVTHSFFGRLTGDQWGVLMFKHLDHHLRQFGA